ncbi:MAG: DUF559 domain-containing protein [Candidatus Margulisbacteria bacterium]|nr:DUF559 domain-containing protein [Candidatus Margulisiibacteriota bacterium]
MTTPNKKFAKILRARELRKNQTAAEQYLWRHLRDRKFKGVKFRRQYLFRGFIIDFYCPEIMLGIELDGAIHNKRKDYDKARDQIINSHGVKLLRFSNDQLLNDTRSVLLKIKENLPLLHSNGEGLKRQNIIQAPKRDEVG